MTEQNTNHPICNYPAKEQVAYLQLLASLLHIDQEFSEAERSKLDNFMNELNIATDQRGLVYSSVFSVTEEETARLTHIIHDLKASDLKYTLVSDLCIFALADSKFTDDEYQHILKLANLLGVEKDQVDAIRSVQENLKTIEDLPSKSNQHKEILKKCVGSLASAGVPIAAIAASGSVLGLSAAGITSGLAALGALVGGSMLAGAVIVVPALAIGAGYAVKKLIDVIWKD